MMKYKSVWFLLLILITGCNRPPQASNSEMQVAESTASTHTAIPSPTQTITPLPMSTPTNAPTITPVPTNTATNTPIPSTPTSTPTLTPTPKPVTHANIGWEGVDMETREPFPDETRIKSKIVESNQNNQMLNSITEEDIRVIWYEADDGTLFWHPYFTINNERVNNDLYLYVYSLKTHSDGNLSPILSPKMLNVTALERLGVVQNITDIQLLWQDHANKPVLAIEKNGVQIWYPDELQQNLVSYDQNLTAIGIPETPESADNFATVLFAHYPQDVYLFRYDETATATAGIGQPNYGPIYKLVNNHWQAVDPPEFIGGGSPQVAYIGYGAEGNGHLYIEEMTNFQIDIQIISNVHIPLAPAAIVDDYVYASPVWSPDGRHVAFLAEGNDSPFLAVYDLEAKTWQPLTPLSKNIEYFSAPIWSPESDWLVYSYSNPGGVPRLTTVSYPDGIPYEIDQGWLANWVQDVDGLRLIYQKSHEELLSVNPDGSDVEVMPIVYNNLDGNSERILEYLPENNAFLIYRYDEEDGMAKLLHVPIDGGEENLLVQFPEQDETFSLFIPTWPYSFISPDGTWFWSLAQAPDGQDGVYILNLETQESRINKTAWFVTGWTPDSHGIIQSTTFGVSIYDVVTDELAYHSQTTGDLRTASSFQNVGFLKWPDEP